MAASTANACLISDSDCVYCFSKARASSRVILHHYTERGLAAREAFGVAKRMERGGLPAFSGEGHLPASESAGKPAHSIRFASNRLGGFLDLTQRPQRENAEGRGGFQRTDRFPVRTSAFCLASLR